MDYRYDSHTVFQIEYYVVGVGNEIQMQGADMEKSRSEYVS